LAWQERISRASHAFNRPVKEFPGAGDNIIRPWKHYFQGWLTGWAAPEKGFPGVAGAIACPLKIDFQRRALYLLLENLISSCVRQGWVARPPLKTPIYPPLETFSAVVIIYLSKLIPSRTWKKRATYRPRGKLRIKLQKITSSF